LEVDVDEEVGSEGEDEDGVEEEEEGDVEEGGGAVLVVEKGRHAARGLLSSPAVHARQRMVDSTHHEDGQLIRS
jgi:hypothetical protein